MKLYKYQGAGNDFLIIDNRAGAPHPSARTISAICNRHYGAGADGIMLLEKAEGYDFGMAYYNSDGSGGMMCGNGGRCIAAFAADLGIEPASPGRYEFIAPDGPHSAEVTPKHGYSSVRLRMKDVSRIKITPDGYFLDTGTRHLVKFVDNLEDYDVLAQGRLIRNKEEYSPEGTNVNFAEAKRGILHVRTYEKGVEGETFACGTGIVATAIAALYHYSLDPQGRRVFKDIICHYSDGRVHVDIRAKVDQLAVDFIGSGNLVSDLWLTGPAAYVCEIDFFPQPEALPSML